jgi:digeranylgeranylglycerophospholipid reductase
LSNNIVKPVVDQKGEEYLEKPEIVVVGGGPCGSYTAYTAAKMDSKVVVCEDHKEIGTPDHCAGHLSISSLKQLGIKIPKNALENEIKGANIYSPSGTKFVLRCQAPVTYVVNRELFDKHLAKAAIDAGAEYRFDSRVKSLLFDSGYVKGVKLKTAEKLESNVVVDAEGCSSAVLRQAGLTGLRSSMVVRGIQADVDGVNGLEDDMVEVYLGRKVAPDFFAWIIPRKDGTAKVGLATSTGNPRQYLRMFMEKHPVASKKLQKSKIKSVSGHPIPLAGPIPKTYANGFLAVGDAAGQVKATTGGGVVFGITCAKVAGEVASQAVKVNDFSERFLSFYQQRWKKRAGFELSAMLRMRRMLNSISDKKMDTFVGLCNRFGIDKTLERFGDVDFQGRSLFPMLRNAGTLSVVGYFLFSWLTSPTRQ